MNNCNYCGALHNNGSRFCSRKCRIKKIEQNKPVYKQMVKRFEASMLGATSPEWHK